MAMKSGVDIKVPWELSRGHHLVLLAQTALLSGDEKYARECLAQMTSWIDANPTAQGVNWACPMDVAIRAVNWLWSLGLLAESPLMTEAWLTEVLASLVAHGRFLMGNLEVRDDGVTTNHYLADLVGLLYLGTLLEGKSVMQRVGRRLRFESWCVRWIGRCSPTAPTMSRVCPITAW
jgi:hypothetical protein